MAYTQSTIVVAVADPAAHTEAVHIAAATGRQVVDAADATQLARHAPKAFALLVDAARAPDLAATSVDRARVFTVAADITTPAEDPNAAFGPACFALPAQAADLLRAIGALSLATGPQASGRVVAVLGAGGGVGASVVACSLGRAAASQSAMLIDAHRVTGALDLILGVEQTPGARWGDLDIGEGAVNHADLRHALPATEDGVAVLTFSRTKVANSHPLTRDELDAVVGAAAGGGLTVVDAPLPLLPGRCDAAVIVAAPQLRSATAASRLVAECNAAGVAPMLLLRDHGWAALSPAEVEHAAGARVVAHVPDVRGLPKTVECHGLPLRLPRGLARAADAVLGEVA